MLSFKEWLEESVGAEGEKYQNKIYRVLFNAKRYIPIPSLSVPRKKSSAYSSHGYGDIEAKYQNIPFNIEVKKSAIDQMGGFSIKYNQKTGEFSFPEHIEDEDKFVLLELVKSKTTQLNDYIDRANELSDDSTSVKIASLPFKSTIDVRDQLKREGLLKNINTVQRYHTKFIEKLYNNKDVYYIQIGGRDNKTTKGSGKGSGLFFLGTNPLNLPIPELDGEFNIEMRIKWAGVKKSDPSIYRTAQLFLIGRFSSFQTSSLYSLEYPDSIKAMFAKLNSSNQPNIS